MLWTPVRRDRTSCNYWRTYTYPNYVVLAVIGDWRQLSKANRIAQEDYRELKAIVDAQTARIQELEARLLEERQRVDTSQTRF